MKLFITGATSFLGSYFLREALHSGNTLRCLRRKGSRTRVPVEGEIEWIERPLGDNFADVFADSDTFVHFLAAGVTPQAIDWDTALSVNVMYSFDLWRQAAEAGVKRFVICGSASEYGTSCQRFEPVPPDAPLEPSGPYASSKAMSSILARALTREYNLELIYVRPFNLYGVGQYEENFWPALRKAALAGEDFEMTEGTQIRDFSPIDDAAKFFLKCVMQRSLTPGSPDFVNFGSGAPKALIDYAEGWWADLEATGQLRPGALVQRANELNKITPLLS
jgi:nucleoside-diphosphate-sugar epimerase